MIIPDRRTQKYSANGIATWFENISLFGLINPTGNKAEERQIIFKSKAGFQISGCPIARAVLKIGRASQF